MNETIPSAILWIFPYYLGRFLLGLFPSIQTLALGLKIDNGFGFRKIIYWNEIEKIVEYKNRIVVLIVNCKGFPFFNGLYFNKIYGSLVHADKPVVFLGSSIENREEIITQTMKNSNLVVYKKT